MENKQQFDDIDHPIGLPEGQEWTSKDLEMVKKHAKDYRAEHPISSVLEQYRDKLPKSYYTPMGDSEETHAIGITQGFDAAIALDLPVLFHEWIDDNFLNTEDAIHKHQCADISELYRFWSNYIYKPE